MCSPSSQAVSLRHSVHLAKETSPSAKTGYAQYRTSHETWQAHPCSSHSPYFTPCCRRYAITSCLCSGLNQYCFPLRKGTINADNSPLSILGSNQSLVSPCAFAKSRIVIDLGGTRAGVSGARVGATCDNVSRFGIGKDAARVSSFVVMVSR